jgi:hypothetical protein
MKIVSNDCNYELITQLFKSLNTIVIVRYSMYVNLGSTGFFFLLAQKKNTSTTSSQTIQTT